MGGRGLGARAFARMLTSKLEAASGAGTANRRPLWSQPAGLFRHGQKDPQVCL